MMTSPEAHDRALQKLQSILDLVHATAMDSIRMEAQSVERPIDMVAIANGADKAIEHAQAIEVWVHHRRERMLEVLKKNQ